MTKKIAIIDYKAGNAPSVLNAFIKIGAAAELKQTPIKMGDVSGIVLPGVGSARATMDSLKETGWIEYLNENVHKGSLPFLGICVGMQVLLEHSEEGDAECLGWFEGNVKRFDSNRGRLKIPQMGWNEAVFTRRVDLIEGLGNSAYFYFVNSYYVEPKNEDIILASTDYGKSFCSMLNKGNIYASQFHLEKSGEAGLRVLRNFFFLSQQREPLR